MSSSKMALKIILYIMLISLASGRPFLPSGASSHFYGVSNPKYMMKLYQTLLENQKDLRRPEIRILVESDTVESLTAKDFTMADNRCSLTFDLSPISRTDELQMVELRIHLPPFPNSRNITVDIYHINDGQNKLFLGSVMTNVPGNRNTTWIIFNVTKVIENSLWEKNLTNHGGHRRSSKIPDIKFFESLKKIKKCNTSLPEITTDQAVIVFFTKHKPFVKPGSPIHFKQLSVNTLKMAALYRQKRSKSEGQLGNPSSNYSMVAEHYKPSCRKVDMIVNFKEIGWDNWVVQPKKYNAYRCQGTCHSPRKETSKTTNYDYIKSFGNLKDSEKMECSSCVPLKMKPLSMIFHEDRHLVLRYHNDMIIEECGSP